MKFVEKVITPICPYCEKKITAIIKVKEDKWLTTVGREIYCCQHCYKVLGIGASG